MHCIYIWRGFDARGRRRTGHVASADREHIYHRLARIGIGGGVVRVSWRTIGHIPFYYSVAVWRITGALTLQQVGMVCQQLAVLHDGGVALDDALRMVQHTSTDRVVQRAVRDLNKRVLAGQSLVAACTHRDWPAMLPIVLAAGQRAGKTGQVLTQLANALQAHRQYRAQVWQALLVPCVTIGVGVLVLIGIVAVVVPLVVSLYPPDSVPIQVAWLHRLAGCATGSAALYVCGGGGMMVVGWRLLAVWQPLLVWRDGVMYRLPFVGRLWRDTHSLVLLSLLKVLLGAEVALCDALVLCRPLVKNACWQAGVDAIMQQLAGGVPLAAVAARISTTSFAPMVGRILCLAHARSELAALCEHAASVMREVVAQRLRVAISLLQPLLMLGIGGVVCGVLAVLIVPLVTHMVPGNG